MAVKVFVIPVNITPKTKPKIIDAIIVIFFISIFI